MLSLFLSFFLSLSVAAAKHLDSMNMRGKNASFWGGFGGFPRLDPVGFVRRSKADGCDTRPGGSEMLFEIRDVQLPPSDHLTL